MIDFAEAELRAFAPKMKDFYRNALLGGKAHLAEAGILDNGKRFSHFMGQCGAETGGFTILRESLTYSSVKRIREVWPARARKETDGTLKALVRNPVALGDWAYGGRMGNRKGTSDGYDYRGGGWIQTTGKAAVADFCGKLGIALRPDILDDPEATLRFACFEWKGSGCNELADANDLMGISKAINVGSASSGVMPNGMEHRDAWFRKAQAMWWDAEDKVAATAPPPTPAAQVASTAKASGTIFGAQVTLLGILTGAFSDAISTVISVVLEAAQQVDLLAPAAKVLSGLGFTTAGIATVIALAGVSYVVFRRLHDAATGKNVK